MGIALNILIAFDKMIYFAKLILPEHKHGMSLHFIISSISFTGLKLSLWGSFTFTASFIHKHFIFSEVAANKRVPVVYPIKLLNS